MEVKYFTLQQHCSMENLQKMVNQYVQQEGFEYELQPLSVITDANGYIRTLTQTVIRRPKPAVTFETLLKDEIQYIPGFGEAYHQAKRRFYEQPVIMDETDAVNIEDTQDIPSTNFSST